jgi:hypothetical protein
MDGRLESDAERGIDSNHSFLVFGEFLSQGSSHRRHTQNLHRLSHLKISSTNGPARNRDMWLLIGQSMTSGAALHIRPTTLRIRECRSFGRAQSSDSVCTQQIWAESEPGKGARFFWTLGAR